MLGGHSLARRACILNRAPVTQMIEIDDAIEKIAAECELLVADSCPTIEALGRVLAQDVAADVDSPPHNKSVVDGFAIRVADAGKHLRLIEQVVAGAIPTLSVEPGTTSQVMTGAPIPDGAEAMVMVEDVEQDGDSVLVPSNVSLGQMIMPRAKTFGQGDVVLQKGTRIRPIEVGLLCEVGRSTIRTYRRPTVAILPTGDELVPCDQKPSVGQIRNSNGPMLESRARVANCEVTSLGIGSDNEQDLKSKIELGLNSDIFILSGGVSAGVRDLVPAMLHSLGVREVFHKVRLKPGKPIWFGVREGADRKTLVFGLPGNPISSLVCFELFVQLAIRLLTGQSKHIERKPIRLAKDYELRGNRPTYYPARSYRDQGRTFAEPLDWQGSADMLTVAQADCLIYFDATKNAYQAGEKLEALTLD